MKKEQIAKQNEILVNENNRLVEENKRLSKESNRFKEKRRAKRKKSILKNLPIYVTLIATIITLAYVRIQTQLISDQNYLSEASRRSSQMFIMGEILSDINRELENPKPEDTIARVSDGLKGRIISLSRSMKPYLYYEDGKLRESSLSPERGQLVVALSESGINKIWLGNEIFKKCDFSYADLRNADLSGISLKGDFTGADFRNSTLEYIVVNNVRLKNANFQGANLSHANFSEMKSSIDITGVKSLDSIRVADLANWENSAKDEKPRKIWFDDSIRKKSASEFDDKYKIDFIEYKKSKAHPRKGWKDSYYTIVKKN